MAVFLCLASKPASGTEMHAGAAAEPLASADLRIDGPRAFGSGVHIGNGYALTAGHVISSNSRAVYRVKDDRGRFRTAKVLWINKANDIALLRLQRWNRLRAALLDCRAPGLGEPIRARGNPLYIEFVTTWGRVAAVRPMGRLFSKTRTVILADMTVNWGMSGGAVYDSDNHVVAIVIEMMTIPVKSSLAVSQQLAVLVPGTVICDLMRDRSARP